ncbi:MAG: aspartate 1-decarboxylase [Oligoflexia bacterium]|nr:aspartate 1-decarboxylase [Oligoflexia bacterium]
MKKLMLKSKIHRAVITGADINYNGSITIDPVLIKAAKLTEYEQVHVVNINNGTRFETYVIKGEKDGDGTICLNGAAARLAIPGDLVIIMSYAMYDPEELDNFMPSIVLVDQNNKLV